MQGLKLDLKNLCHKYINIHILYLWHSYTYNTVFVKKIVYRDVIIVSDTIDNYVQKGLYLIYYFTYV